MSRRVTKAAKAVTSSDEGRRLAGGSGGCVAHCAIGHVGERVFSMLKRLFGEQQMSALADYIQAALMLNYNDRAVG